MSTGPGVDPTVRVVTSMDDRSLVPYGAALRGGVNVAMGDIDGDGTPDIITGAGPGGGPHVRVLSGVDFHELASFYAFNPSFAGGVFVASADIDGDGRADIIAGAGAGGSPQVRVFSGVDLHEIASFLAYTPLLLGGVRVAAADVDGDGRADIITGAGPGGGPHVRVFSGVDLHEIDSFYAYTPTFAGGVYVAAGDVDGDGHADIITGAGAGGGPHVRVFSGVDLHELASFFAYDPTFAGGVHVAAGDIDEDGRVDVITGAGPGGDPHVKAFSGATFAEVFEILAFDGASGVSVASTGDAGTGAGASERFTSAVSATIDAGTAFTFTVRTVGTRIPTLTSIGTLPSGVTFVDNGDGTATLSGTASVGGVYRATFMAANGVGASARQLFTLMVRLAPTIASAPSVTFAPGTARSFTVATTGFPAPTLTQSGALPPGITFVDNGNGTGVLQGTAAAGTGGTYALQFTATNSLASVVQNFTLNIRDITIPSNGAPLVMGSGPGSTAVVRVISATTDRTLAAYVPAFLGGVQVTLGDIDGDGTVDIVTAAGPGGGPHIRVLSGVDFHDLFSFYAFEPSFSGGVNVALGDIDGDGTPDIIAGSGPGGNGHVRVFSGKDLHELASFLAYAPSFAGGVFVAAGDIDGDGRADIITGAGAELGGSPHVRVFSGVDLHELASFYAYAPIFSGGVRVAAGDVDGDGHSDIITGAGVGGGPHVRVFSGADLHELASFYAYAPAFTGGISVAAGDIDGDGHADIITGAGPGGGPEVHVFSGADMHNAFMAFGLSSAVDIHTIATFQAFSTGSGVSVGSIGDQAILGFTSQGSTSFQAGTAGTFTITAVGVPAPALSFSGTLPAGVSFTDNGGGTATLAGTPAANSGGTYPLTLTAANGVHTATQTFTLTVNQAPAVTSAATATFSIGAPGTFAVTSTGFPRPTLTQSGALAAGVTWVDNGDGTGTLSGTPAAGTGGTHSFTLTATNGIGAPATQSFTLSVNGAGSFTSANNAAFTVGAAGAFSITTSSFPAATAIARGGVALPTGVTFTDNHDGTATLAGTPAAGTGGTYAITFTFNNGVAGNIVQNFTLTVLEPPLFTSANSTTFAPNAAGSFLVTLSGFPAPTVTVTGSLPSGVTFTPGTRLLAGTPTQTGSFPLVFTASNGVGSPVTQNFTLSVNGAPSITSANTAMFLLNTAGTFQVVMTGSPPPTVTVTTGVLLTGLALSSAGLLSGTPTQSGSFPVTLTATNGTLPDATQNFTVVVNTPPAITSANAATFALNTAGTFQVVMTGFPAPTVSVTAGVLPNGVTLSPAGLLAGMPTQSGSFAVTLTATNGTLPDATQSFTVLVGAPPAITSANGATFVSNVPGTTFQVVMTGFPAPTVSVTGGVLPNGLTLSAAGLLSGTATQGGVFPVTLTATNGTVPNATQSFTVTVNQPPTFTSAAAATFVVGASNTFTVTTNGVPNATFVASGVLPSGVTFTDNGNGTATLAGPPAIGTNGTYPLDITATNAIGSAPQNFVLTVSSSSTPIITSAASATFTVGGIESFTVTTAAFPAVNVISEIGVLPSGVTFVNNNDGTATLSGRPNPGTAGVYPLIITASNGGPGANQPFTLTVGAAAGGAPTITSASTTSFVIGVSGTFTVTTTGTPAAAILQIGALPGGVTFTDNGDGTATLTGMPAAGSAGSYALTFTATNGVGTPASQNFTLMVANNVAASPLFTSAPSGTFTIGVSGNFDITTAATPAVTSITRVGVLPAGVGFLDNGDGTARLSGTPQALTAGEYPVTFVATGPGGTTTQSFTLKVQEAASVTSAASTTFTTGTLGTFTVTTRGVPTPALTMTGTPVAGVTFVDNGNGTGTLSGTPAAGTGGTHSFTITSIDGVGTPGTQSFTLTVNDAGIFTSANNTSFTVGAAGTFSITTSSFPAATTITRTGALPTGVTFTSNGDGTATLAGTPAAGQGGTYPLTFSFNNGVAGPVTQNFTLTVQQPPLFTSANSTTFTVGTPANFTLTASGVPAATITNTGGTPPAGVTYTSATRVLAGTATQTGPFALQFTATNGVPPDATQNFTLTVACPAITVNPSTLADGLFNTAYGPFTFTQTGSTGSSFTWSATGLPAGLSIAPTTGIVSGTPTTTVVGVPGSIAITVTDNFGCTGTRNTTVTIRPVAGNDTFGNAVGNTQLAVGAVGALPLTPVAVVGGNVKTNDNGVGAPGALSVVLAATSTNLGTITEGAADGSFLYTPPANFAGTSDTFTYTLTDGNNVTNTGTVTINFLNRIWYVNGAAAVNGDGRSNSPFNNLNNAQAPSLAGDIVYVHTGGATTPGNLAMDANSTLQGAGGAVSLNGGALSISAGVAPTLSGTVTLNDNTAIKNVTFSGAAPAMTASALATTQAILIDGVTVTGGTNALSLTNVTGTNTLTVSNSSFTNTSGAEVFVSGGNMPLAIGATISSNAGRVIDIQNRTSGAVTFSGSVTGSSGTGIILNANGTSGFTFSGGVTLNGASATFTATTNGSLTMTGTNTIGATTPPASTALTVANTSIGASGLTFQSIFANGGVNGIVLNTTGNSGGLTVTGSGTTAGSGGTIQNTVQGALFTTTRNLSLSNMNFTNANSGNGTVNNVDNATFNSAAQAAINLSSVTTATFTNLNVNGNGGAGGAQVGINGQNVSGLTIANSTVSGFGDAPGEGDVKLWNLTGTSAVTNSTFSFVSGDTTAGENLFEVRNDTGTLTLNVTGSTFKDTRSSVNGSGGVSMTTVSGATATLNASNNDFLNLKTSGIETFARDSSTMNVNITDGSVVGAGNVFDPQGGTGRAIGLNAEDTAHLNFNINRNSKIYGHGGPIVNVFGINNAVIQGHINSNPDIRGGGVASVGSPINVHPEDNATATIEIVGNTITQIGQDPGIFAFSHGDGATALSATLDVTIQSNTLSMNGTGAAGNGSVGIDTRAGSNAGDLIKTCVDVQNNAVTLSAPADDFAWLLREGSSTSNLFVEGWNTNSNTTWNGRGNTPANSTFVLNAGGAPAIGAPPAGAPYNGLCRVPANPVQ